jgi:hypothetical protein
MIPHQHPQQLARIYTIGFCSPFMPVHLYARRVHNPVFDPTARQVSVQPETISSRFVTTYHSDIITHPKMLLRISERCLQLKHVEMAPDFRTGV